MAANVYEEITDNIIQAVEKGAGKFQMPWHRSGHRPVNALTGASYRGVNILQLILSQGRQAFDGHFWATFKQWRELNAQVKKGAKGTAVVFFKTLTAEQKAEDDTPDAAPSEPKLKKFPMLKRSVVFNAAQVEGWAAPEQPLPDKTRRLAQAEDFVGRTHAEVRHGGDLAFYRSSDDFIQMPPRSNFTGSDTSDATESYYSTLLHELVHWSGHPKRCDRALGNRFGSDAYAMEELIAELGASFLCADLQITLTVRIDHAQYIEHWLKVMKGDNRAIFTAANRAMTALDYLHGLQTGHAPVILSEAPAAAPQGGTMQADREPPPTAALERNAAQDVLTRYEAGKAKRLEVKQQKQGRLFE